MEGSLVRFLARSAMIHDDGEQIGSAAAGFERRGAKVGRE